MTGFSLSENYTDNLEKLMRRAQPHVIPPLAILPAQEPSSEAPLVLEAMAEKTLRGFSVPLLTLANVSFQGSHGA